MPAWVEWWVSSRSSSSSKEYSTASSSWDPARLSVRVYTTSWTAPSRAAYSIGVPRLVNFRDPIPATLTCYITRLQGWRRHVVGTEHLRQRNQRGVLLLRQHVVSLRRGGRRGGPSVSHPDGIDVHPGLRRRRRKRRWYVVTGLFQLLQPGQSVRHLDSNIAWGCSGRERGTIWARGLR